MGANDIGEIKTALTKLLSDAELEATHEQRDLWRAHADLAHQKHAYRRWLQLSAIVGILFLALLTARLSLVYTAVYSPSAYAKVTARQWTLVVSALVASVCVPSALVASWRDSMYVENSWTQRRFPAPRSYAT